MAAAPVQYTLSLLNALPILTNTVSGVGTTVTFDSTTGVWNLAGVTVSGGSVVVSGSNMTSSDCRHDDVTHTVALIITGTLIVRNDLTLTSASAVNLVSGASL